MLKRLLPWMLLGPLTGPLAFGLRACIERRRFAMAAVYALGLVEVWTGLPTILAKELSLIARMRV
jgi:hypothetical protein